MKVAVEGSSGSLKTDSLSCFMLLEGGMSKKDSRQAVAVSVASHRQYHWLLQLESLVVTAQQQLRRTPRQAAAL